MMIIISAKEEEKKNLTSKIKSLQSEKQGLDTSATKLTENIAVRKMAFACSECSPIMIQLKFF